MTQFCRLVVPYVAAWSAHPDWKRFRLLRWRPERPRLSSPAIEFVEWCLTLVPECQAKMLNLNLASCKIHATKYSYIRYVTYMYTCQQVLRPQVQVQVQIPKPQVRVQYKCSSLKYKYMYFKHVLEYNSSTSTSTKNTSLVMMMMAFYKLLVQAPKSRHKGSNHLPCSGSLMVKERMRSS